MPAVCERIREYDGQYCDSASCNVGVKMHCWCCVYDEFFISLYKYGISMNISEESIVNFCKMKFLYVGVS